MIKNESTFNAFDIGIIEKVEETIFENKEYLQNFFPYPTTYIVKLITRPEVVTNVHLLGLGESGDNYEVYEEGTRVLIGYIGSYDDPFILSTVSKSEFFSKSFINEEKDYVEKGEKIIGTSGSSIKFSQTGKLALRGKIVDGYTGEENPAEMILGGIQTVSSNTGEAKAAVLRVGKGELGFDVKGNFFIRFFDWMGLGRVFKFLARKLIRLITYDEDGRIELESNLINLSANRFFRLVIGDTNNVEEEEFQDNVLVVIGDPDVEDPKGTVTFRIGNKITLKINQTEITINKDEDGKLCVDVGEGNDVEIVGKTINIKPEDKVSIGNGSYMLVSAELLQSIFNGHSHTNGNNGAPTGTPIKPIGSASSIAVSKIKSD